jgi:hypothetical protein
MSIDKIIKTILSEQIWKHGRIYKKCGFLDISKIKEFKKDFLTLMKNVKIVNNYDSVWKWKKIVGKWTIEFDDYINKYFKSEFEDLIYSKEISEEIYKDWSKRIIKDTWKFIVDFRGVPIDFSDKTTDKHWYYTKEMRYVDYINKLPKWESKTRRSARIAWNTLDEFVKLYEFNAGKRFFIDDPTIETIEIGGFSVILKYQKSGYFQPEEVVPRLKEAIKVLNNNTSRIPILLKRKLPLFVDLTKSVGLDKGGEVKYGEIIIYGNIINEDVKFLAKVIAHELAHKVWDDFLSSKDKELWSNFISGNWEELDLQDFVRRYGDEKFVFDNNNIKVKDPILYLQIQGLYSNPMTRTDFNELI